MKIDLSLDIFGEIAFPPIRETFEDDRQQKRAGTRGTSSLYMYFKLFETSARADIHCGQSLKIERIEHCGVRYENYSKVSLCSVGHSPSKNTDRVLGVEQQKKRSFCIKWKMVAMKTDILSFNIFKPQSEYNATHTRNNGMLFTENSLQWLKTIQDESIDLIFSDPPYNIKKADWDKFSSQEEYIKWSLEWIKESSRILKPSGSLYICGFSEILADLKHPSMRYFSGCKWLIWHYRNKANLGKDWGRSHESILHFRKSKKFELNIDEVRIPYGNHTLKYPAHPQAESSQYSKNGQKKTIWSPNPLGAKPKDVFEIPTTCNGMGEKTKHPTQKPEELLRKLILASSKVGDIILDPFSGSGTTLVVAEQLQRLWIGCEMNHEYNSWAIKRIDHVIPRSIEKWIEFDKENLKRRESIR